MNQKFPTPKRAINCIWLAVTCVVLMFGAIFFTAYLTGMREAEEFTQTDKTIFFIFIVAELFFSVMYFIFVIGAARLFRMRTMLIQKRYDRLGFVDNTVIYQPYRDIWMDLEHGKRAVSYMQKKLILVLIEEYDDLQAEWIPKAMEVYDSQQELEKSLQEEYGIEWEQNAQVKEKADSAVIRVSIEDSER